MGQNQSYNFENEGDYLLILVADNGVCESRDSSLISVRLPEIFIPNAFTPNQDDINEFFKITGLESLKSFKISVFDRWGIELFTNENNPNLFWDGTKNGKPVTEGVYVYYARFTKPNGVEFIRTGSVTLLR